jgi:hypothetical protein
MPIVTNKRELPAHVAMPMITTLAAAAAVVAALDLIACAVYWEMHGVTVMQVARGPAAWIVGIPATRAMGPWAALLGLVVMYILAAVEVAGYRWLATRARLQRLIRQPVRFGMLYGALAFAMLNWILVPLSAAPGLRAEGNWLVVLLLIHVFMIGVPCALLARQLTLRSDHARG